MSSLLSATVLGGYLGSGKTTLVNKLLRNAGELRLAILVNEFGALPIDQDLIEAQNDDLISIAGGCICCSFGSDLTAALMEMAKRDPRPDHVVIESSGVAMPGAIGASIGLLESYQLAGVVVLADSETVRQNASDEYLGDTIVRQLKDADLIIQTKTDLVSEAHSVALKEWLGSINSRAAQLDAAHGKVPVALVLGHSTDSSLATGSQHTDMEFESCVFEVENAQNAQQLASSIATGDFGVLRAKGFVPSFDNQTYLIQTVGLRSRAELYSGDVIHNDVLHNMVCIGLCGQLDRDGLLELLANSTDS